MGKIQATSTKAPQGNEPKNTQSQENAPTQASNMAELDELKMPLVAERLSRHDINRDGYFNVVELEGLPEASLIFDYLFHLLEILFF